MAHLQVLFGLERPGQRPSAVPRSEVAQGEGGVPADGGHRVAEEIRQRLLRVPVPDRRQGEGRPGPDRRVSVVQKGAEAGPVTQDLEIHHPLERRRLQESVVGTELGDSHKDPLGPVGLPASPQRGGGQGGRAGRDQEPEAVAGPPPNAPPTGGHRGAGVGKSRHGSPGPATGREHSGRSSRTPGSGLPSVTHRGGIHRPPPRRSGQKATVRVTFAVKNLSITRPSATSRRSMKTR